MSKTFLYHPQKIATYGKRNHILPNTLGKTVGFGVEEEFTGEIPLYDFFVQYLLQPNRLVELDIYSGDNVHAKKFFLHDQGVVLVGEDELGIQKMENGTDFLLKLKELMTPLSDVPSLMMNMNKSTFAVLAHMAQLSTESPIITYEKLQQEMMNSTHKIAYLSKKMLGEQKLSIETAVKELRNLRLLSFTQEECQLTQEGQILCEQLLKVHTMMEVWFAYEQGNHIANETVCFLRNDSLCFFVTEEETINLGSLNEKDFIQLWKEVFYQGIVPAQVELQITLETTGWECSCGKHNAESSNFCMACGSPKPIEAKVPKTDAPQFCMKCGTKRTEGSVFCMTCGTKF